MDIKTTAAIAIALASSAALAETYSDGNETIATGVTKVWTDGSKTSASTVTVNGDLTVTGGAFQPGLLELVQTVQAPVVTLGPIAGGPGYLLAPDAITVDASSLLNINDSVTVANALSTDGTVTVGSGGFLSVGSLNQTSGLLAGSGSVIVSGVTPGDLSGEVSPGIQSGDYIGQLDIDSAGFGFTGVYTPEIRYNGSGWDADLVNFTGTGNPLPFILSINEYDAEIDDNLPVGSEITVLTSETLITDISGVTFLPLAVFSDTRTFDLQIGDGGYSLKVVVVPEPMSLAWVGLGLSALLRRRRG
jgi:uncharacterized protein (TIGR03382 family)